MPGTDADYFMRINWEMVGVQNVEGFLRQFLGGINDLKDGINLLNQKIDTLTSKLDNVKRASMGASSSVSNLGQQVRVTALDLDKLLGRVGGRIVGAELGRLSGIPGGGFIGSQIAYGLNLSGGAAMGIVGAAGGLAAAYGLSKSTEDVLKYAQEQRNMSEELGVSIDRMSTMTRVSDILGEKLDSSAKSLGKLSEEMMKGRGRAAEIGGALAQLGLDTSVAFEPVDASMNKIAAGLAKIKDLPERFRIADILGVRDLAAVADQFQDAMQRMTVDTSNLENLAKAKDHLNGLWDALKRNWREGVSSFVAAWQAVHGMSLGNIGSMATQYDNSWINQQDRISGQPAHLYVDTRTGKIIRNEIGTPVTGALPILHFVPPEEVAARAKDNNTRSMSEFLASIGTPQQQHQEQIKDLGLIEGALTNLEGNGKNYVLTQKDIGSIDQSLVGKTLGQAFLETRNRRSVDDERYRHSEEVLSQQRRLQEMLHDPDLMNPENVFQNMRKLREFDLLPDKYPGLVRLRKTLWGVAKSPTFTIGQSEFASMPELFGGSISVPSLLLGPSPIESFAHSNFSKLQDQIYSQSESQFREDSKRSMQISEEDKKLRDQIVNESIRQMIEESGAYTGRNKAITARSHAQALGFSQYGMLPLQVAQKQYRISQSNIAQNLSDDLDALTSKLNVLTIGLGQPGISDDTKRNLQRERDQTLVDIETRKIESETRGVEALRQFNDAVEKAAGSVKTQFSEGIVSILMGAQEGAYHGHAGQAAKNAARSFGEKIESTMLQNTLEHVLFGNDPHKKMGGVLGKIGSHLPPWMTQGTIFQQTDTQKIADNLKNVTDGNAIRVVPVDIPGNPNSWLSSAPPVPTNGGPLYPNGGGYINYGMPTSGGGPVPGGGVSIGGMPLPQWGTPLADAVSLMKVAGAGLLAYEGVSTISRGGARNALSGAGELGGSAAAILPLLGLGAAAPLVGAGAAGLMFASAMFPDPRSDRSYWINERMFAQQYLAPPAQNLSEAGNAGYADFDMFGNVRTSGLSPYPTTTDPYIDLPRRTTVPGRTTGQFGGNVNLPPSANNPTPAPVQVTINAIDRKGFVDHASDIADALNHALMGGAHPVNNTIARNIGVRN